MVAARNRNFLWQFAKRPRSTGAVAPSSANLATEMTRGLGIPSANLVLEYGPGTGVFTRRIAAEKGPATRFLSFEINTAFAERLRTAHPDWEIHNCSVEQAPALLDELGLGPADCIVSGLPWAAFTPAEQSRLLGATAQLLRPGGGFTTFAYLHGLALPTAHRFRRLLGDHFSRVETSPTVWRNLPPAFVYRCKR